MGQLTSVSIESVSDQAKASKYGLMVAFTKADGIMIVRMGGDDLYIKMVTAMKVSGQTTKLKAKAHIPNRMELATLELGEMTCRTEEELRLTLKVLPTRANSTKAGSMGLEKRDFLMGKRIRESFKTT